MRTKDTGEPNGTSPLSIDLNRSLLATGLFTIFVLAYIAAPYWLAPASSLLKAVFLAATVVLGVFWSRLASDSLQIRVDRGAWKKAAASLVLLVLLNLRTLTSPIPWRGDEASHIGKATRLAEMIPLGWAALAVLVLLGVFAVARWKPRYALPVSLILVVGSVGLFLVREPPPLDPILRYPFISRWFHAVVPMLFQPITGLHHEVLYRIVPFLSAAALACAFARRVSSRGIALIVALAAAVGTIPVVYYYSSILYLEMPAVVLMFLVCAEAEDLLAQDFAGLKKNPAWYALILIGFIKETAVAFLLCCVACRLAVRFISAARRKHFLRAFRDELWVALCTLLPIAFYLVFRVFFGGRRSFQWNPQNLIDLQALKVVLLSYLEQFGPAFFLFLAGLVVLFKGRQRAKMLFLVAAVLATLAFHLVDSKVLAGYSRFNLFILPPLLAGSAVFVGYVYRWKKWSVYALLALVVGINIVLSPVNLDGTKKPYWGNYLTDTSEHYYPYREVISWLKEHHHSEKILFANLHPSYDFEFYFDKLSWHPSYEVSPPQPAQDGSSPLQAALTRAVDEKIRIVVFHVMEKDFKDPGQLSGFRRERLFSNMAHSLALYVRM